MLKCAPKAGRMGLLGCVMGVKEAEENFGMNTTVKLVILALLAVHCGRTYALNYYLKPAATDWNDTESYALGSVDGGKPSTTPGSSDVVYLPAGKVCSFTNGTESFNVFANVHTVVPHVNGGDEIEITVGSGTNELNCAITGYGYDNRKLDSYCQCVVTKKGAGALALKSVDKYGAATINYDYLCCFTVEMGDLIMPQNPVTATVYSGALTVAAGARFFLAPTIDTAFHNGLGLVGGLHGTGLVTNDNAAAALLYSIGYAKAGAIEDVPFSGRIDGAVHLLVASADLMGTNSMFTGSAYATYGQVNNVPKDRYGMKVRKFGKTGQPSSIGSGDIVGGGLYGGYILYTGDVDEECDKKFYFDATYNSDMPPNTFDAGHHGGLHFTDRKVDLFSGQVLPEQAGSDGLQCRSLRHRRADKQLAIYRRLSAASAPCDEARHRCMGAFGQREGLY